jgi:hypothetical protein
MTGWKKVMTNEVRNFEFLKLESPMQGVMKEPLVLEVQKF